MIIHHIIINISVPALASTTYQIWLYFFGQTVSHDQAGVAAAAAAAKKKKKERIWDEAFI